MSHGHPQDGELVGFSGQGGARGDHVGELGYVGRHLVPPAALYLAVVLPAARRQAKGQGSIREKRGEEGKGRAQESCSHARS